MVNFKNFFSLPIIGLFVICFTFSFNAFASDPKDNIPPELGEAKSAFTLIASRPSGLSNESTNSNADSTTNDQRVNQVPTKKRKKIKKEEKIKNFIQNVRNNLCHLYSYLDRSRDNDSNSFLSSTETNNSNACDIVIDSISDVKERYEGYIKKTNNGLNKKNTLDNVNLRSGQEVDEVVQRALKEKTYRLESTEPKDKYGRRFCMLIDVGGDYELHCGLMFKESEKDKEKNDKLEADCDIDSRSTPSRIISSDDSSINKLNFNPEKSLSQSSLSPLESHDKSVSFDASSIDERSTPIDVFKPVHLRCTTMWAQKRKSDFKVDNVVRAKTNICIGSLVVDKGTLGVIIKKEHDKYNVLFSAKGGTPIILEGVKSSDLEFILNHHKQFFKK